MNNFHIYRDGKYDRAANLKLKLDQKIDEIKPIVLEKLEEFDYYWKHHHRMVR